MNWNSLLHQLFNGVLTVTVVFISYYFSRFYVSYNRKEETQPASKRERIVNYVFCIIVIVGMGIFFQVLWKSSYCVKLCSISIIPSLLGMSKGYQRDAKMTTDQRKKVKYEMDNMDALDKNSYSDNIG